MSLFGSIQMAGNTLQAMQIGLHVVGNNIANAKAQRQKPIATGGISRRIARPTTQFPAQNSADRESSR